MKIAFLPEILDFAHNTMSSESFLIFINSNKLPADAGAIGPRADLRVLPKKTGRLIRVKNFSLFEGNARV